MEKTEAASLTELLAAVRACRACEDHLPLGPRPVLRASPASRILIVGQAPGTRVHASGIPWNDPSGNRLRAWLGLDGDAFYDESRIAIIPMGYCYPGREYAPRYFPLPHPSPRNTLWLRRNPWFERDLVPVLRRRIHALYRQ